MADIESTPAERLLVCIGPSPSSAGLIRSVQQLAADLHAKWFAVYVETPGMLVRPEAESNRVADNLGLAEQLGAESVTLRGRNIAEEIFAFARERNITRIVAGKPRTPFWKGILLGHPVDQLVRISGDIDVHIMIAEPGEQTAASRTVRPGKTRLADYGAGFLFFVLANALCFGMYPYFQLSNLIMVYLVGVMLTAIGCGRGPAILISFLSVLAFDVFFVPPRFLLTVYDTQYFVTFAVMFLVALVITQLAARLRQQTEVALLQERQASVMHGLTRQLASARGVEKILQVAMAYISEFFDCRIMALLPDDKGKLIVAAGDSASVIEKDLVKGFSLAQSVYDTGQTAGWGTQVSPTSEILFIPLQAADSTLGLFALRPMDPERLLSPRHLNLLESLSRQVALALEVEVLSRQCPTTPNN
jgi:two-component system, OmpR family, sensor histidine kinase KdpD